MCGGSGWEVVGSAGSASGNRRGHRSLGGPGFTAQQFTTYTPAPALLRLEFVTCRFIFLPIKAPLQARRDSWRCGEGEGERGKCIRRGLKWKNKACETPGTKLGLMTVRESGREGGSACRCQFTAMLSLSLTDPFSGSPISVELNHRCLKENLHVALHVKVKNTSRPYLECSLGLWSLFKAFWSN